MSLGIVHLVVILKLIWAGSIYGKTINVNPAGGNDSEDCLTGEVACSSLDYALTNLQNGDCVNITSDTVSLPRMVNLSDLDAITIRGEGNTIVMCHNTGGVSCNNCSNVVIEGITWDQCGDPNKQSRAYPESEIFGGLNFTNVTNLLINNCILQNSRVRALSLYLVAGSISISNTQFLNNANNDTIYCFRAHDEYIHCVTDERNVTGAVYIRDATSAASISISNCMFSNNGHFGNIRDDAPSDTEFASSEIADGAAVRISLRTNLPINITVESSKFLCNRGRSGGAINIFTSLNYSRIIFNNVRFFNNSVIRPYVNSSALMVHIRNGSFAEISNCIFQCNHDGRNVIGYIAEREPSNVTISNCSFLANTDYNIGLIELNIQSHSMIRLEDSHLANNTGAALMYIQLRSSNITVSLHGLNITNNTGSSVLRRGGLLFFGLFEDHCTVSITRLFYTMNSFVRNGGGLYITGSYRTDFTCYVQDAHFESNIGRGQGTVIFSILQSDRVYNFTIYNSTFINNTGGSIVRIGKTPLMEEIELLFEPLFLYLGKHTKFSNNNGTAIRLSDAALVGNENTEFRHNRAESGAALYLTDSYVVSCFSSFQFNFFENFAAIHGGAIFIESTLQCSWLVRRLDMMDNSTSSSCNYVYSINGCPSLTCRNVPDNTQTCHFNYANNSALAAGSEIFYNVPSSTPIGNSFDSNSVFYIPKDHCMNFSTSPRRLATQPYKLKLEAPATCLDDNCTTYYLSGITLGQEIRIPAKIVGYNNESAEATTFFVTCVENCTCTNIEIIGRSPVLINDWLSGIHIIGGKNATTTSVKLQLSSDTITLNLIVGFTSCSPGFVYDSTTKQCECFTTDDIISCSPNATIQRDHWFGVVDGITTVSICPIGYCNFSRRGDEVDFGRFLLSTIQDDQCNSHRTGPACGECDPGYTLSYDSVDCVNIDDCHDGYIAVVILGTLLYWILLIISVFALMWLIINHLEYGDGIGYLYGIIYYYSMADVLMGQILNYSNGLRTLVLINSVFFKLNPGFDLFKFCFVGGMQRIDQYFIDYIYSTVTLLFLLLLVLLTRRQYFRRLTMLIGKVIIPVICLIMTIAYTSIADTSLQLLQFISFVGVDGTYIYLSPSIRYCTGRHIAYFLIALLYELVIVAGLPLLLILSRWTNKINLVFVRIDMKPILDQFQGCYKDNCRWFAAVYFICRQVFLLIVVIEFSDFYIELYLLIIVCLITAALHYSIQPYKNDILNKFDGMILLLLILVVSLQMVAFSNGFTASAIEGVAYILLLLPIAFMFTALSVLLLKLWLAKKTDSNGMDVQQTNALLNGQPNHTSAEINITRERVISFSASDCIDYQETLFNYISPDD